MVELQQNGRLSPPQPGSDERHAKLGEMGQSLKRSSDIFSSEFKELKGLLQSQASLMDKLLKFGSQSQSSTVIPAARGTSPSLIPAENGIIPKTPLGNSLDNTSMIGIEDNTDMNGVGSVFGPKLSSVDENLRSKKGRELDGVSVRQVDKGLSFVEKKRECNALHMYDKMPKSNGLCNKSYGSDMQLSQAILGESKKAADNVVIYGKVGEQKLVLGHLIPGQIPQLSFDLVFDDEFELSHSGKNGSVHFAGYQSVMGEEDDGSEKDFDDISSEEDEELAEPVQVIATENGKVENAKAAKSNAVKLAKKGKTPVTEKSKAQTPKSAGGIFAQGAKLVVQALESGKIFQGEGFKYVQEMFETRTLHLIGLMSDGGVHSRLDQVQLLLKGVVEHGAKRIRLHVLTDDRDVLDGSSVGFAETLENDLAKLREKGVDAQIASGGGRMNVTMDRYENDWGVVKRGWDAQVPGKAPHKFKSVVEAIKTLRVEPKANDQYLPPFVIVDDSGKPVGPIVDGDVVVTFNFQADRMVMAAKAFACTDFDKCDGEVDAVRKASQQLLDNVFDDASGYYYNHNEETELDVANYQLEMMMCLREVNVDNNTVGGYQSTLLGSFPTVELFDDTTSICPVDFYFGVEKKVLIFDPGGGMLDDSILIMEECIFEEKMGVPESFSTSFKSDFKDILHCSSIWKEIDHRIATFLLKRFKASGSYAEKIDTHVELPMDLDFMLYTSGNNSDVKLKCNATGINGLDIDSSTSRYMKLPQTQWREINALPVNGHLIFLKGQVFWETLTGTILAFNLKEVQYILSLPSCKLSSLTTSVKFDGTNYASICHQADIELAVGIARTEVNKQSVDVILDDNFSRVVVMIKWEYVQLLLTVQSLIKPEIAKLLETET